MMKAIVITVLILAVVTVLIGCGSDPSGKYVNRYKEGQYMILREDGSVTVKLKNQTLRGKYKLQGKRIVFTFGDYKDKATLDGKFIQDSQGDIWAKE